MSTVSASARKGKKTSFSDLVVTSDLKSRLVVSQPNASNMEMDVDLQFDSMYSLEKKLRSGAFATVWVTSNRITKEQFAVKVINRK